MYDELYANDVWIADNHTFDFFTAGENGKPHRLYLTAFTDAKNGVFVRIAGEKVWYYGKETILHIGEQVYVRYDPANPSPS